MEESVKITVVIPVKDGEKFLPETFEGLLAQLGDVSFEVCVYNDGSTDRTQDIIEDFREKFEASGIDFKCSAGKESQGVGYAKNRAVEMASGRYICFNDADDISLPERLTKMLKFAQEFEKNGEELLFLGCNFYRLPENSTVRYTRWANGITDENVRKQIYTSNGPSITAPTWFLSKSIFDEFGLFHEEKHGYPEDLEYFYRCLDGNVHFHVLPQCLVMYRYHPDCASFGVSEKTILKMRTERIRRDVLKDVEFTIWNAGKQGKQFFKSLCDKEQANVVAFCDVDSAKIQRGFHEEFDEVKRAVSHRIPIVHVRNASPLLIVCVKQDMTNGQMEALIEEKNWREGDDFIHFG